ncbi:MAG: putative DNA binding domain-containing protein [Mariniphaga sp.]|nr:putative DNA binding domain-containing protein [Mariniphaga sp.]
MTEEHLKNFISMGEGYQAEFKLQLPKKASQIAEEVCAFANASGGVLVVGMNDQGDAIHTELSNKNLSDVQNAINNINPRIYCRMENVTVNGIRLFIIEVPSGENKPYVLSGAIYVRIGPNTQKLSTAEEMREFFQRSDKIFFDEAPCPGFNFPDDIDQQIFDFFLLESGITSTTPKQQVFENLRLFDSESKVKNATVLFFGSEPQKFIEKAITRCVAYDGEDKRFIADDKRFGGPLYSQYRNTLNWIKGKINVGYDIEGQGAGPRKEVWEIPETVFKEAIVNALSHRDYYEKGATILIEVFENRVEITNPGGLVSAILPEQFGTKSFSRNPLVFGLFSRMNLVEQVGSGIQRMKNLMRSVDLPEPAFLFDGMFSIVLHRPVNWSQKRSKFLNRLTENQMKIMDLIAENPGITKKILSAKLQVGTTTIDNNIRKLKESNLLSRTGSDKTGKWVIL